MPFITCPECGQRHAVHKDSFGHYIYCPELENSSNITGKTYFTVVEKKSDSTILNPAPEEFVQLKLRI